MTQNLESLLTPSLSGSKLAQPMYSLSSHIIVAFVGGPVGLLLFSMNSIRYARLIKRWWAFYVGLILMVFVSQYCLGLILVNGFFEWIPLEHTRTSDIRLANRVIGLTLMAIVYFAQHRLFNISNLKGDMPSAWIPGIICCVVGYILTSYIATGAFVYAQ